MEVTNNRSSHPLRNKDFLRLWMGLCFSLVAGGMWMIALPLISLSLGFTAFHIGVIVACGLVGTLLSLLLGGVLIDRYPKGIILSLSALVPAVVLLITYFLLRLQISASISLEVCALIVGMCDGIYGPANESILPEILDTQDLVKGNGFQAVVEALVLKACGPAIGGIAITYCGSAGTILWVSMLFFAVFIATLGISHSHIPHSENQTLSVMSFFSDLSDGFKYVKQTQWLWVGIIWASLALLLQSGCRSIALPVLFGKDHASHYVAITIAYGLCAAIGSLGATMLPAPKNTIKALFLAWGLGSIPFAFIFYAHQFMDVLIVMALVGVCNSYGNVQWQTLLQSGVAHEVRGRVISVDWFGSISLMPFSTILTGIFIDAGKIYDLYLCAGIIPTILALAAYKKVRANDTCYLV